MKKRKTGYKGYEACNGCGVCTLPCPIWQQSHDALLTFAGRARALQGGADAEDLRESVSACLLCGSCEPVCSMNIKTVDITLGLRRELNGTVFRDGAPVSAVPSRNVKTIFLPGGALRVRAALLEKTASLLDLPVVDDDGADIVEAFAAGTIVDSERESSFITALSGVQSMVTPVGILKRYVRSVIPAMDIRGLGETLITLPMIQNALKETDLYLIDACSYNADFQRCMPLYTDISRKTGCAMNLDLQRIAIPTGSSYRPEGDAAPAVTGQIEWILEGKTFDRIVVETVEDIAALEGLTDIPVIHIAELAGTGME